MKLRELYNGGLEILSKKGVPDAGNDARLLLQDAFSMSLSEYLLNCERELTEIFETSELIARKEDYEQSLYLRGRRVPLQQILGETQFMGLDFAVTPDVLIPRQDTETLVEQVLYDFPSRDICVLDMCTGSGCIAAALAVLGGYNEVVGADISEKALYVAQKNAMKLMKEKSARTDMKRSFISSLFSKDEDDFHQQVRFVKSDLFSDMGAAMEELGFEKFDVIVSNPPYIRSKDIEELEPEVRDFEPRMALDGTEDGLHFYRRIAGECVPYLKKGGSIYLEIGCDQGEDVKEIFKDAGFCELTVIKDLAGKDRVVKGKWTGDKASLNKSEE